VWGAAPRDTRVFVDGVPVPSLYHLGGYRAAVGNDLVGDIRLTPAAFGPDRGRAIGGVIDIGFTDPADLPEWRAQADFLDVAAAGRQTLGRVSVAAAIRKSSHRMHRCRSGPMVSSRSRRSSPTTSRSAAS
jgi:hypothetical protein